MTQAGRETVFARPGGPAEGRAAAGQAAVTQAGRETVFVRAVEKQFSVPPGAGRDAMWEREGRGKA